MRVKGTSLALVCSMAALAAPAVHASGDLRLIDAARNRNREAVRTLLARKVDVNARQGDGATALHWAAHRDDLDTVTLLIRAGANVNVVNDLGVTPLYLACENGSAAIVEALVKGGADANAMLPSGETALMTAARTGSVGVVKALITGGANVHGREKRDGQTALMWAAARRHPEVVDMLIRAGADVGARSSVYRKMVARASGRGEEGGAIVEMEQGGSTPLLFASRVGDVASARLLLAAGADVNDTTPDGASVLVVAAHSGQTDVALFLLDKGTDPNAARGGYSALHLAVLREDTVLQKALLVRGADPNIRLTRGTVLGFQTKSFVIDGRFAGATPFFMAAKYGDSAAMRLLAEAGADPLLGLPDGTTPLMVAAGMFTEGFARSGTDRLGRSIDTAELELGLSQDEDIRPLLNSGIEAVKLAIGMGADVNAANASGDTAMHAAAELGFDTVIRYLVSKGAKVDVKNKRGRTPLMVALSNKDADDKGIGTLTVDLLRKLSEMPSGNQ